MNLFFRPMRSAELSKIVDLWAASWSEVYSDVSFEGRRGWFIDHINAWTTHGGICHVAVDNEGTLAGFILHNISNGHLDQFCVRRDLKGQGFAKMMMAEVRRLSPEGIYLDVNAMNTRAIRFYEREGFVKAKEGLDTTSGQLKYYYRWPP